jgi:imidazolonepropionase-like amidohydrolase
VYERAGLPAPFVLQMATIISARVMKDDRDYGSIAPGKVADLIIVNGKPAERLSELRKIEQVIRGGRLFNVQELKAATGIR